MVTATNVMGVMKMGNIVPRSGIRLTSLAFQASVLTITPPRLPDVPTMLTTTYVAPCLRGQCTLLLPWYTHWPSPWWDGSAINSPSLSRPPDTHGLAHWQAPSAYTPITPNLFSLRSSERTQDGKAIRKLWAGSKFGLPSPSRKFVAHPGSIDYIQKVCTQFDPVRTNVMRTSLVWWGY